MPTKVFRSKRYFEGVKYKTASDFRNQHLSQSAITNLRAPPVMSQRALLLNCILVMSFFFSNHADFNPTFVALLTMSLPVARAWDSALAATNALDTCVQRDSLVFVKYVDFFLYSLLPGSPVCAVCVGRPQRAAAVQRVCWHTPGNRH